MLATLSQTPESFFRGACSIPANAEKFFGALAAFLQTPKSFSGHLQRSCKLQKVFRGACSIPANSKKFFEALAAFLQTPKSFSGHLQHCCKLQKVFRETCNSVASVSRSTLAVTALNQRHAPEIRDLILTPNSRLLSSDQARFPHKEQEQIAEY